MAGTESGLVFNVQRYSVHDGPGIRTTVFLKGCPLRCTWCHNPEGMSPGREMIVIESRCSACGTCRAACLAADSLPGVGPIPPGHAACTLCGACVSACPTGARQIVGREMTVSEVMAEVSRDGLFYDDSGGGVTFSGGEPLHQPRFLRALLEASRSAGFRTALDTCGYAASRVLSEVAPLTDLFLYDLKMIDDEKHRRYTGVSNQAILENLRILNRAGANLWLRMPIIPGVNDSDSDVEAAARFVSTLGSVRQVHLLPYHAAGSHKYRSMGRDPALAGPAPLAPSRLADIVRHFEQLALPVHVGG